MVSVPKISDFEDLTHSFISLNNSTTSTSLNAADLKLVKIVEFLEKGCSMRMPKNRCAAGHQLLFTVDAKNIGSMDFTAKVATSERLDDASVLVSLEFYQVNQKKWDALLLQYAERQAQLNQIVRDLKD